RPVPIASVQNEFDFYVEAETLVAGGDRSRRFLVRNTVRLQFGWQEIEVYGPFSAAIWRPEVARMWAETDLLAAVARRNLQDAQFRAIDPNAAARKRVALLLEEFQGILNGPEEQVHQFIRDHPELLSPTHTRMWSKLPLGARVTDFI